MKFFSVYRVNSDVECSVLDQLDNLGRQMDIKNSNGRGQEIQGVYDYLEG